MPGKYEDLLDLDHPDVVDEIIGKPPSWIVRRGIMVIMVIIAMVFAGASLIKYPDIVKGKVSIEAMPTGKYLAVSRLNYDMSYRVKIGQKAIIKLRDRKYDNSGHLVATVSGVDNETDSVAVVQLSLDKGLATSKGQLIPPDANLGGDLQIIGEKHTLLQRLFFRE